MNEKPAYNASGLNTEAITWALKALGKKAAYYKLARDYYRGDHPLCFASEKFKNTFGKTFGAMKVNLCQLVVDTIADRLIVEGFGVKHRATDKANQSNQTAAEKLAAAALDVWELNRMETRAPDLMVETLTCGESFLIVWPDPEHEGNLNGQRDVILYPHDAGSVAVEYHPEKPGYVVRGAKAWIENGFVRLNIYTGRDIEKYITKEKAESLPEKADAFMRYVAKNVAGQPAEPWPVVNEWGKCPVFHIPNGKHRFSELAPIIDAQNGYNKTTCDMMVAMEFFAAPQRWAVGIEPEDDEEATEAWKSGADRLWTSDSPESKFGQFPASDPASFLDVRNAFRNDMAITAGIPPHYFELKGGDVPSGVALQILETRLSRKVQKLQGIVGNVLADAMLLALRMRGEAVDGVRLETLWEDTAPRDDKAAADTQEVKQRLGVSKRQSLREMSYSDAQIDQMESDRAEEQKASGDLMGKLFNAGA